MIESNIKEGNQKLSNPNNLEYGLSITDACVNLNTTTKMLERMAGSWNNRHSKKRNMDGSHSASIENWSHEDFVNNIRC